MVPLKSDVDIKMKGEYMTEDFTQVEVDTNYTDLPPKALPTVNVDINCKKQTFNFFFLQFFVLDF